MEVKNSLINGATVAVTGLALVLGGHRVVQILTPPPDPFEPVTVAEWRQYSSEGHRRGSDEAQVVIVEFFDFQCPFCRAAAPDLDTLLHRYDEELAVVYRHFPLPNHPHSVDAAHAAECAALLGYFVPYHDVLFADAESLGQTTWGEFALRSGVAEADLSRFQACFEGQLGAERIHADTAAANQLGIGATPTFLINDLKVEGHPGLQRLEALVRQALEASDDRGAADVDESGAATFKRSNAEAVPKGSG